MDKLLLGVAREIITPEVGCQLYGYRPDVFSTSVEDDLTATAFYFKQGETEALMISATVCSFRNELAQSILALIEEKYGIPKENIFLSATHTHSGPNLTGETGWGDIDQKYRDEILVPSILSVVKKAKENTQPVTMSFARGKSDVGINRRQLSQKGNYVFLGQNPWGPYNPYMTVLTFNGESDRCVANIIHYGCHGTSAGANTEITRDWSGHMTDALEAVSGGITAFFNGPEGDVGPRLSNGKTTGDITYVRELGRIAAADVLRINLDKTECDATLAVYHGDIKIPLQPLMDLQEAKEVYERVKNETVNINGKVRRQLETIIQMHEKGDKGDENVTFPQTLIKLGNFVFASFPYEVYSEIGMRIDTFFENETILSLSNTNGSEGYFCTEDSLCYGGYETNMFKYGRAQRFAENADFTMIIETVENINKLLNKEN